MLVYLLLYISFLIPALLEIRNSNAVKSYGIYYFLMFIFFFTAGIRDLIGGYDVYVYRAVFLSDLNNSTFEYGFVNYLRFIKEFTSSEYVMFFITASIITITTFTNLKRYSNYIFLALFIFFCKFYLMSYVYLRQGIAMGIVWFSLKFVFQRKPLKFIITVFIAFLFHKSALVFAFVYLFIKKFNLLIYFGVFSIFLLLSITNIIDPLLTIISFLNERYEGYGTIENSNYNILYVLEAFVCFTVFLMNFKNIDKKNIKEVVILNGFFFYILLQLLAAKKGIFVRLTWYYLIFYCIVLSTFINEFKFNRLIFKPILILGFTLLFFRMLFVWDNGDFLPYKSIFDNTERNSIWKQLK